MDIFNALAEPTRRKLLNRIMQEPCTVNTLVDTAGISQPAVSKHLKYLREAGVVSVTPEGQRRWYDLNPAAFNELEAFLEAYRAYLSGRLDALEEHLDNMD